MNEVLNIRDNLEFFEEIENERDSRFQGIIFTIEHVLLTCGVDIAEKIKNNYDYEGDKFPDYLNIGPYHREKINEYNKKHGTNRDTYLSREEYEKIYKKEKDEQLTKDINEMITQSMPKMRRLHKKLVNYLVTRKKLFDKAVGVDLRIKVWEDFDSYVTIIEQKILHIMQRFGSFGLEDIDRVEKCLELISPVLSSKLKHFLSYDNYEDCIENTNNIVKSAKELLWSENSTKPIDNEHWTKIKKCLEKNIPAEEKININRVIEILKAMKPKNVRQIIKEWWS